MLGDAAQWRAVPRRTRSLKVFLSDLRVLRGENNYADRALRQSASLIELEAALKGAALFISPFSSHRLISKHPH